MWLDAVAVAVLGLFAGMGAVRGGLTAGLQLATLAFSYGAAIVVGPRLGGAVGGALGVPSLIGAAVAGTLAFLVMLLATSLLSAVLRRIARPFGGFARGRRDRFLGASFGGLRGAVVVLMLAWLALFADALRSTGTLDWVPSVEGSRAAELTSAAVEAGLGAALAGAGPAGRVAARVAGRPGEALAGLRALLADPRVEALLADRRFWTQVEAGAVDAALRQPSYLGISRDSELRESLATLGAVDPRAAANASAFRDAMREALREVGPRLRGLREDPAFRELLHDPAVVAILERGDTWRLLGHPGFLRLVTRVATAGS